MQHTLESPLRGKKSYPNLFGNPAKNRVGDVDQATQYGPDNKACWYADQYKGTDMFGMTQGIFGGNSPPKGMSKKNERRTYIQTIQHQFEVINQPIQRKRQFFRVVTQAVPAYIRSNDAHRLPKVA